MLGSQHAERRAEERVRTRGEHGERVVAFAVDRGTSTSAPSERPIHSRCICLRLLRPVQVVQVLQQAIGVGSVIFSSHCRIGLRTTGWLPRSLLPSMTSSLARTVPSSSHQLTATSAW